MYDVQVNMSEIKYKTKKGWKVAFSLLDAMFDKNFTGELEVPVIEIIEKKRIVEAIREENRAWLRHERCTVCGKRKEAAPLMDMCGKCLEET